MDEVHGSGRTNRIRTCPRIEGRYARISLFAREFGAVAREFHCLSSNSGPLSANFTVCPRIREFLAFTFPYRYMISLKICPASRSIIFKRLSFFIKIVLNCFSLFSSRRNIIRLPELSVTMSY